MTTVLNVTITDPVTGETGTSTVTITAPTPPPPPGPVESANGTTLNSTAGSIVDANLAVWTLVASTLGGLVVFKDGAPAGFSFQVGLLLYENHVIYQENLSGNFYEWLGTTWNGPLSDPRPNPPDPFSKEFAGVF